MTSCRCGVCSWADMVIIPISLLFLLLHLLLLLNSLILSYISDRRGQETPLSFINQSTCWITVWHTYILNRLLFRVLFFVGACSTANFSLLSRGASLKLLLCVFSVTERRWWRRGEGWIFLISCDEGLCGGSGPSGGTA